MKKFLLGILLPILTFVTIVGTGFATWYFDGNLSATPAEATVGVSVEKYAQIGTVTATPSTNLTLNFDQSKGGVEGLKLVDDKKANASIVATYTPASNPSTGGNIDTSVGAKFVITLELGANLAKYVTLDTNGTNKWVADKNVAGKYTLTFNNVTAVQSVTISSADFKYHDTGDGTNTFAEPTTVEQYNAMHGVVNGQTVKITLNASIANPNAPATA